MSEHRFFYVIKTLLVVKNELISFFCLVESTKDAQRMRVKLKGMRTFDTGRFEIKKRRGIKPR